MKTRLTTLTIPMMTMMNKRVKLTGILVFLAMAVAAQTDMGAWYEINADYKIFKGLRLDFETSIRTDKNASRVETFYFEPGVRYKINDFLAAGIYYRFIEQIENDGKFYPRHRWFLQFRGNIPAGRFTFSARDRVQQQFKTYIEDPGDEVPSWYNRLRFEVDYDVPSIPLAPFINVELYSQMFASNDILVEKVRYMAGLEYTVGKKHKFGLSYIYNTSKVTKPAYMNIVALKYGISL